MWKGARRTRPTTNARAWLPSFSCRPCAPPSEHDRTLDPASTDRILQRGIDGRGAHLESSLRSMPASGSIGCPGRIGRGRFGKATVTTDDDAETRHWVGAHFVCPE